MLLATGPLLGKTGLFPAWSSLWPVTAALLILASAADRRPIGVGRLLAWRPLALLGDRSYGLYLWHGPVLVFATSLVGQVRVDFLTGLLVLVLSIGLAVVSKATLEKPLSAFLAREQSFLRLILRAALLVTVMLAAVGAWALNLSAAKQIERDQLAVTLLTGHPPLVDGLPVIVPGPMIASTDRPDVFADGCLPWLGDPRPLSCHYGPADAPIQIALVGSSHAAHWLPALQEIARARGWAIVTFVKASCTFGRGDDDNFGRPAPDCADWNTKVAAQLQATRPSLVVTLATLNKIPPERIPAGSVDQWRSLGAAGIPVLALRDTPWFDFDVPACVARLGENDPRCARPRAPGAGHQLVPPGGWPPNVLVFAPREWLCTADRCPPVLDGRMVYSDNSHLTATFARSLAPQLAPWIDQTLALEPVNHRP